VLWLGPAKTHVKQWPLPCNAQALIFRQLHDFVEGVKHGTLLARSAEPVKMTNQLLLDEKCVSLLIENKVCLSFMHREDICCLYKHCHHAEQCTYLLL